MSYELTDRHIRELLLPVSKAGEALVRLDERVARSPVRAGFLERQHFADAVSSLWLDGDLVHIEDLVLHDAHMNVRAPTHELIRASEVLRLRRQIAGQAPDWAFSGAGLAVLRGGGRADPQSNLGTEGSMGTGENGATVALDAFSAELAEMDAVLARSNAALENVSPEFIRERDPLVYEADWDEDERIAKWKAVVASTEALPAALRVAVALDAWSDLQVLQHAPWIGRLLAAALLRLSGSDSAHLLSINVGLRAVPRERRRARTRFARLLALLDGLIFASEMGLKEHDRLLLAKGQMERRLTGRQVNSKLPALVDLALTRPLLSASMIARELSVTPQGALGLCRALNLREITGRSRYRAWSLL